MKRNTMKRNRRRRGVIILVVLSLLVVFLMVGVAFVISAGQYHTAARQASSRDLTGTDSRLDLDRAMYQLVRDTKNAQSVIRGHSLLEDLYGDNGFRGQVDALVRANGTNATNVQDALVAGEQLLAVRITRETTTTFGPEDQRRWQTFGQYAGCVLTFTSGAARNQSTRIVNYQPVDANQAIVHLMLPEGEKFAHVPAQLDRLLVNGRPYSGTGAGYDGTTGRLDLPDQIGAAPNDPETPRLSMPSALVPNRIPVANPNTIRNPAYASGGVNESYDAPDALNMFLAYVPPDPVERTGPAGTPNNRMIIPSFHRPALIHYWWANNSSSTRYRRPEYRWAYILRPNAPLNVLETQRLPPATESAFERTLRLGFPVHAQFPPLPISPDAPSDTPFENLIHGPWDVDNDGDGVRDSIWVDLGFPVMTDAGGREYKPLFAILCVDLDGRLNLNAHGSLAHIERREADPDLVPGGVLMANDQFTRDANGTVNGVLGQGYGPPEIDLWPLFGDTATYRRLLQGGTTGVGRYGNNTTVMTAYPVAGAPREVGDIDALTPRERAEFFNHPAEGRLSAFRGDANLHSQLVFGVDYRGNPIFESPVPPTVPRVPGAQWQAEHSEYAVNLGRTGPRGTAGGRDKPFTLAELERVLRRNDRDAHTLPSRLVDLANMLQEPEGGEMRRPYEITTDSWDLPVPSIMLDSAKRTRPGGTPAANLPRHITDLLAMRLAAENPSVTGNALVTLINNAVQTLLSPDLVKGLRMDVNRPFGDGRDRNGNNVVDEPGEPGQQITIGGSTAAMDLGNEDVRQRYARHLYVLALLLTDAGFDPTGVSGSGYTMPMHPAEDGSLTPLEKRDLTCRRIAQWAINAVDFRDADAIMSPFEYDLSPFTDADDDGNPWDVDGDIRANSPDNAQDYRRLVWGCEYPELLITETLAFHDRRAEDTDRAAPNEAGEPDTLRAKYDPADPTILADDADQDLDQVRIPQGSAYVELYCTGDGNNPANLPAELYTNGALDLSRWAGNAPVWRLAVSSHHAPEGNNPRDENNMWLRIGPDHPNAENFSSLALDPDDFYVEGEQATIGSTIDKIEIERIVWFAPQNPIDWAAQFPSESTYPHSDRIYRNSAVGFNPAVRPGRYAVVGPRERNYIGWIEDPVGQAGPEIQLAANNITVRNHNGTAQSVSNVQPIVGIVATATGPAGWPNQAADVGFSISEPLPNVYYPQPDTTTSGSRDATLMDAYSTPKSVPLDLEAGTPGTPLGADFGEAQSGTWENYKTVFLQRLANPLLAWNPLPGRLGHNPDLPINPYITIDWMPFDITVFSAQERRPSDFPEEIPFDTAGDLENVDLEFATRQRGLDSDTNPNLWRPVSELPVGSPRDTSNANAVFPYNLQQSQQHSVGFLNRAYGTRRAAPVEYVGSPNQPFPWLVWNDRPYVSQLELMQVPASSPGRLLSEFQTNVNGARYASGATGGGFDDLRTPFGHLLNFYDSSNSGPNALNFHRLMEFLHVPSRFAATKTVIFENGEFNPEQHIFFQYREPGRVNLNTMPSIRVWNAMRQGQAPGWNALVQSRRGYGALSDNQTELNADVPTYFANPFRSFSGGELQPFDDLIRDDIDASIFRTDRALPIDPNGPTPQSLIQSNLSGMHADPIRHSYMHYHGLQRLGNMVTTRSNVYAVWITMGYFEVLSNGTLKLEIGSDLGDVKRHRAFYIIDRSIPVAFERGVNHNVDNCVLVRSYIE